MEKSECKEKIEYQEEKSFKKEICEENHSEEKLKKMRVIYKKKRVRKGLKRSEDWGEKQKKVKKEALASDKIYSFPTIVLCAEFRSYKTNCY